MTARTNSKRAGITTGMYDVRRADGSTVAIYDEYRVAKMRREFDDEAVEIVWIARSEMSARVDTMRCMRDVA